MARIPLLGSFGEGRSLDVNARQLVNAFLETQPTSTATQLAAYGTPGLKVFATPQAAEVRGMHVFNGSLWAVVGNILYEITTGATVTSRGTLSTSSGVVSMADNGSNATSGGQQLMIVDGPNGYFYDLAVPGFSTISDVDFPGGDTVAFLNQRFLVNDPNSGRFYGSALLDAGAWNGLDFATAEGDGDDLLAVVADSGNLMLLGERSTEVWSDTGGPDFPFARFSNGFIDIGVLGSHAWTHAGNTVYALIKDRQGDRALARFSGQTWETVTLPGIAHRWNDYTTVSDARLFSYQMAGHEFVVCTFPTANETWVYDLRQPIDAAWHRWGSGASHTRVRGQNHVLFNGKHYVGDFSNGNIYELDLDEFDDNGTTITRDIIAGPFYGDGARLFARELEILMESGVGNAGQANPNMELRISRDGGHNFDAAKTAAIGAAGATTTRIRWRRLGSGYSLTFWIRLVDPVKFAIVAAVLEASRGGE